MDFAQPRAFRTGNNPAGDYQESSSEADGANHGGSLLFLEGGSKPAGYIFRRAWLDI
jgi:hypothetical protein